MGPKVQNLLFVGPQDIGLLVELRNEIVFFDFGGSQIIFLEGGSEFFYGFDFSFQFFVFFFEESYCFGKSFYVLGLFSFYFLFLSDQIMCIVEFHF